MTSRAIGTAAGLALLLACSGPALADGEGEEDWAGEAAEELNDAAADAGEQMPLLPVAPGKSAIEDVTEENEQEFFGSSSEEEE